MPHCVSLHNSSSNQQDLGVQSTINGQALLTRQLCL